MAIGGNTNLKVLLIQLPHPSNLSRNVPLAPGYLKAWAHRCRLLDEADVEILHSDCCDRSGCRRLVDSIVERSPDVLGISLYLWNSVRTMFVVEQVRKQLPHLVVVAGGPEVSLRTTHITGNRNIDFLVFGEGEETFADLLRHFLRQTPKVTDISGIAFRQDGTLKVNPERQPIENLELLPSPYLLGYIDPADYREMMIFTMRGCLQGCRYCTWSARGRLRASNLEQVRDELLLARKMGKEVIFSIADSAFNTSPIFREFCTMAGEINSDKRLHFNCFIQAELIDREAAQLLKNANVVGVEVGLQSASAEVLRNVARPVDLEKFDEGLANLRRADIPVMVDTILGLPGDTLPGFERTMAFVAARRFDTSMFNLSLSEGSGLRSTMQHFGAEIQENAPYYVRSTASFPADDIREAMRRYLRFSADFNPLTDLPYPMIVNDTSGSGCGDALTVADLIENPPGCPISHLVVSLGSSAAMSTLASLSDVIAHHAGSHFSVLCLSAGGTATDEIEALQTFMLAISRISRNNPYITWDIMFEGFGYHLQQEVLDRVRGCLPKSKSFLDYQHELFPSDLARICRTPANVLAIYPWLPGCDQPTVQERNCILKLVPDPGASEAADLGEVLNGYGSAILVDFPAGVSLEFVREIMQRMCGTKGKTIFFKDWVLQRIWEQDFLNVTPDRQSRFEVLIDHRGEVYARNATDIDLYWDAITRWRLLRPEQGVKDIDKFIIDRIVEKISLAAQGCET